MYYESMPLYPRMGCDGGRDDCVRVPMFGSERCGTGHMPDPCACRRVTIENPCRPGEFAEVLLSVDECGNLVVCVRRDSCRPPCPPEPRCLPAACPPPRRDCCRGRLYGSWT